MIRPVAISLFLAAGLVVFGCSSPGKSPEQTGRLVGLFQYMADAALFTDCNTGLRWPVLMEEDFRRAERAYAAAAKPGDELMVSLDGRIVRRPGMDNGPPRDFLVIEHFDKAMPGDLCRPKSWRADSLMINTLPYGIGR